jgi:hypothetical protein
MSDLPKKKLLMQVLTPESVLAAEKPARKPSRGRSSTDLIARLYEQIDGAIDEVNASADPVTKKVEALKSIAKTIPLLQAAERNASLKVRNKQLEDLTDAELEQLVSKQREARNKKENATNDVQPVLQSDDEI